MDILANARRHRDKLAGPLLSFEVPEWGNGPDEPLVIYYRETCTPELWSRLVQPLAQNLSDVRSQVETVYRLALDDNGNRLFRTRAVVEALSKESDSRVFRNVVGHLLNAVMEQPSVEDLQKN